MNDQKARYQRVLLIDDNEIDNFINERMITTCGFAAEVIVKDSADAALTWLNGLLDSDPLPEIIFLDLNMPGKDGFGFLSDFESANDRIRSFCRIVVLSSSISPEDISRASTNAHVIKYVNKPLSDKYLEAIVR